MRILLDGLVKLLGNLTHALVVGVTRGLADALKLYQRHIVMLADLFHRTGNLGFQSVIGDEVDIGRGVALLNAREHAGHGGAEGVEVGTTPALIFVLADGRTCP